MVMSGVKGTEKKTFFYRILDGVERAGNKLPHPFTLFILLCAAVIAISFIAARMELSVQHPTSGEEVIVKSLMSAEGIRYMILNMVKNFSDFAPLGLVLTMMLGVGMAEEAGLMTAFMKKFMVGASDRMLLISIFLVGICGNIASDAAAVIVPSIAGAIFYATKRNPLVGIAAGYAAACAGFSANLLIAGTDALLAGITEEAAKIIDPNITVNPTVNYYFMVASTLILTFAGVWVTNKYVIPLAGDYISKGTIKEDQNLEITKAEKTGLRKAGIVTLVYWGLMIISLIPKNSPLRSDNGTIIPSPFISGIVPFIFLWFVIAGIAYGKAVGAIRSEADIPRLMANAMKGMAGYIVLVFVIAQFVNYFNWTNLGMVISVTLTKALSALNFTGLPMIIGVLIISTIINIFIGSGSAKWALLAPVFVPMFMMLDYSPSFAQLAYRIGDSTTNAITPLFPYFPILLGFMKKYDDSAGVGTAMSYILPYTLVFGAVWILQLIIWFLLALPLGPGSSIFM
ncbi:AbgT family transporter [Geosporobacter ferrireducens]|uniref:p-aminobenzoyl-glutamate transporter n=1 Tax=Geosporobacter ferrireducens TaxID=1424294 RepID=A0A1D8GDI2_9FIRM|nr:AbgT family transporter [Geosporobacter ferrireducens]AOT68970.1 p-aminobenzoyl-glutamate transporter [Geosporobacter ferrireducens]